MARRLISERSNVPLFSPRSAKTLRFSLPLPAAGLLVCATSLMSACGDEDLRPAEWAYISPVIMQPSCATTSCHSKAQAAAGLDFSDPGRGYESLFDLEVWVVEPAATPGPGGCKVAHGTVVCPRPSRALVTPFNPDQSRLVNLLRANGAARMPPDRPLPEADIRLIERWILDGARFKPLPIDAGATD
jgi:hypothetical protein